MTTSLTLELPAELLDFVETMVQQGKFESASAYVGALIEINRGKLPSLELALPEGMVSEAVEWSSQDWEEMKQRLVEEHRS